MRRDIFGTIAGLPIVFAPVCAPLLPFSYLIVLAPLRIAYHSATKDDPVFVKRRDGKRHEFVKKATVIARLNAATATDLLLGHRFPADLKPPIPLGIMHQNHHAKPKTLRAETATADRVAKPIANVKLYRGQFAHCRIQSIIW